MEDEVGILPSTPLNYCKSPGTKFHSRLKCEREEKKVETAEPGGVGGESSGNNHSKLSSSICCSTPSERKMSAGCPTSPPRTPIPYSSTRPTTLFSTPIGSSSSTLPPSSILSSVHSSLFSPENLYSAMTPQLSSQSSFLPWGGVDKTDEPIPGRHVYNMCFDIGNRSVAKTSLESAPSLSPFGIAPNDRLQGNSSSSSSVSTSNGNITQMYMPSDSTDTIIGTCGTTATTDKNNTTSRFHHPSLPPFSSSSFPSPPPENLLFCSSRCDSAATSGFSGGDGWHPGFTESAGLMRGGGGTGTFCAARASGGFPYERTVMQALQQSLHPSLCSPPALSASSSGFLDFATFPSASRGLPERAVVGRGPLRGDLTCIHLPPYSFATSHSPSEHPAAVAPLGRAAGGSLPAAGGRPGISPIFSPPALGGQSSPFSFPYPPFFDNPSKSVNPLPSPRMLNLRHSTALSCHTFEPRRICGVHSSPSSSCGLCGICEYMPRRAPHFSLPSVLARGLGETGKGSGGADIREVAEGAGLCFPVGDHPSGIPASSAPCAVLEGVGSEHLSSMGRSGRIRAPHWKLPSMQFVQSDEFAEFLQGRVKDWDKSGEALRGERKGGARVRRRVTVKKSVLPKVEEIVKPARWSAAVKFPTDIAPKEEKFSKRRPPITQAEQAVNCWLRSSTPAKLRSTRNANSIWAAIRGSSNEFAKVGTNMNIVHDNHRNKVVSSIPSSPRAEVCFSEEGEEDVSMGRGEGGGREGALGRQASISNESNITSGTNWSTTSTSIHGSSDVVSSLMHWIGTDGNNVASSNSSINSNTNNTNDLFGIIPCNTTTPTTSNSSRTLIGNSNSNNTNIMSSNTANTSTVPALTTGAALSSRIGILTDSTFFTRDPCLFSLSRQSTEDRVELRNRLAEACVDENLYYYGWDDFSNRNDNSDIAGERLSVEGTIG